MTLNSYIGLMMMNKWFIMLEQILQVKKWGVKMERKIFAFIGDFYHSFSTWEQVIETAVSRFEDVSLECQLPTAEGVAQAIEQNPEIIIIGAENRINPEDEVVHYWLTNEIDDKLEAYVASGGSLLVLHSGLAFYPSDSKYRKMIKGEFLSHPPEHCEVRFFNQDNSNPINADKDGYDIKIIDEFYFVDVDVEETNLFLYSECEEHDLQIASWYHDYGDGKVSCVVPAHNAEAFELLEMQRLYRDEILYGLYRSGSL